MWNIIKCKAIKVQVKNQLKMRDNLQFIIVFLVAEEKNKREQQYRHLKKINIL